MSAIRRLARVLPLAAVFLLKAAGAGASPADSLAAATGPGDAPELVDRVVAVVDEIGRASCRERV